MSAPLLLSLLPDVATFAQAGGEVGEAPTPLGDAGRALGETFRELLFLPEQASTVAPAIDRLQYVEITVFWAIGIALFLVTGWWIVRYRRRGADEDFAPTPEVRAPLWLELAVAGGLLAFFVGVWWVGFRQYVGVSRAPEGAMDVMVTGRQWVWKFAYADGPTSAGVLYVPAGRPVRLVLTSRDVIHSFFVPDFRLKRDAVPGTYTTLWFHAPDPGRHQVLCAEFCGPGHSRMWGEVVVLSPADFQRWVETGSAPSDVPPPRAGGTRPFGTAETPGRSTLVERGRESAVAHGCVQCHSVDGSAHLAPTWRGLWGSRVPLEGGDTVTATPGYLTESMMDPQAKIVAGWDPVMPSYHGQLATEEVGAILQYIRSLRGDPRPEDTPPPEPSPPGGGDGGASPDTAAPGGPPGGGR